MNLEFVIRVIITLLMFKPATSQTCDVANWWESLDQQGWSVCPKMNTYLRGFLRSNRLLGDERVGRLEEGRCCEADEPSYAIQPAACSNANWTSTLDGFNVWALCPSSYYLNGLRLQRGYPAFLSHIKLGQCCRPRNHPNSYEDCYDEDVTSSFDTRGWSECQRAGYYMTGFYKNNCNELNCIDKFRCCKMKKEITAISDWSPFTTCSASCGGGLKTRYRTCNTSRFGENVCSALGPFFEEQQCNVHDCNEDATISDWSSFTTCSASCGGGLKTRYRTCNRSRFGGKDCSALGPLTEQQPCNIHDCNGLTSREIIIVSAFGSVLCIVLAALAAIFFKKHRAGGKPNIPYGSDQEEIQPYVTVRLSRIFPLNDESNGPGNTDIPLETLPFQLRTPQEERATGKTEFRNSPYENTDHLGEPSVTPVEYLFYQSRYENETVNSESRYVVIRPGYDKLTFATTNLPREYDSLIRETDLGCKSRRGDITDTEGEDNMNIYTILEVTSSDERTPACSMDKKKNQEISLGKIKYECIENVWKKETLT